MRLMSTMPGINFFGSFHHWSVQRLRQLKTDNSCYECDDAKDDKVDICVQTALNNNTKEMYLE